MFLTTDGGLHKFWLVNVSNGKGNLKCCPCMSKVSGSFPVLCGWGFFCRFLLFFFGWSFRFCFFFPSLRSEKLKSRKNQYWIHTFFGRLRNTFLTGLSSFSAPPLGSSLKKRG